MIVRKFGKLTTRQIGPSRVVFEFDPGGTVWTNESVLDVEFVGSGCLLPLKTKQAIMGAIRDILLKELQDGPPKP